MINKLRILIRELLIKELGTFGATHPANDKKQDSNDSENGENTDSEEQEIEQPS